MEEESAALKTRVHGLHAERDTMQRRLEAVGSDPETLQVRTRRPRRRVTRVPSLYLRRSSGRRVPIRNMRGLR